MLGGYAGVIAKIDLTSREVSKSELSPEIAKQFISGRGLGVKILYDMLRPKTDPLSANNVLVLTAGVLAGTSSPFSSRSYIVTKSPLSGTILMSNSGGYFGPELKFAGYDAVIISGKASEPSYIWINDDKIEIRSASHLWGMKVMETDTKIVAETDAQAKVACIGPAAEKFVRFACIRSGDRAFGRGGAGTVMASKNLKAIAVRGHGKIKIADNEAFGTAVSQTLEAFRTNGFMQEWRKFGTPYIVGPMNELGLFPTRNFQTGLFEKYENIDGNAHKKYVPRHITCFNCPVACNAWSVVESGEYAGSECRGPEYQTFWAFGGGCGNSNLESIIAANTICNDLGLDTESTGSVIAFAMELFERGILTEDDTDGMELHFGDHRTMVKLINLIGNREGIGDILADGVKRASEKIGKGAEQFAIHVKGLEIDGYEPRGAKAQALSYATASRGGCHHSGYAKQELYDATFDRFTEKDKGKITKENEDSTAFVDSTGVCAFPHQLNVVSDALIANLLQAATGIKEFGSVPNLLEIGERIMNQERLFNIREGFTNKDDTLPKHFLIDPMPTGNSKGQTVNLAPMLEQYYEVRGWTKKGVPKKSTLKRLSLC